MLSASTPDTKQFMNLLLTGTVFDRFQLCEASIMTGLTYVMDGHINKEFYDTEDEHLTPGRIYQYWEECRPIAFQMIKGSRTPLAMKIILMLDRERTEYFLQNNNIPLLPEQIAGLYLNIRYEHNILTLSSGTALTVFSLDKTVEHMWDEALARFLREQGITLIKE